jgi:MscS family membrane protein
MFDNQLVKHAFIAFLIVLGSWFFSKVLKFVLNTFFKKLFAQTKTTLDDRILEVVRGRITTLSIIAGIYIGIREVRKGLTFEEITAHQILDYLNIVLFVVLIFVITRLVSRIIQTTFEWYMDEVAKKTHTDLKPTVAPLTTKILNILLFLIASMILLEHFGVNIGSLLVSLGVGSLAIALAAQETVANMIAGFVILVDQPFRVGDRIKLPSGEEGDVFQIGLRSTRILNYDNNLVVIPNAELVKNRIINFSFPDNVVRILVEVTLAYGTDLDEAKSILINLAKSNAGILKEPQPSVYVMNLGDTGIQLRLVARTADFNKKFDIETSLRDQIYKVFSKAGIEIPYPQRVIHMANSNAAEARQTK